MTPDRTLGRRFFEAQDRLRGGPDPALCAPGYTAHLAGFPPMDLAGHQQFARAFYAAFPDLSHTVEDTVADGDREAVRFSIHGTHTGDFMGLPATGKPVVVSAMAVMRVEGGRVAALHGVFDQMGLMRQLGAVPSSEAAPEAAALPA